MTYTSNFTPTLNSISWHFSGCFSQLRWSISSSYFYLSDHLILLFPPPPLWCSGVSVLLKIPKMAPFHTVLHTGGLHGTSWVFSIQQTLWPRAPKNSSPDLLSSHGGLLLCQSQASKFCGYLRIPVPFS